MLQCISNILTRCHWLFMDEMPSLVGFKPCLVGRKDAKRSDCFLTELPLPSGDWMPRLFSHPQPSLLQHIGVHFPAVLQIAKEENVLTHVPLLLKPASKPAVTIMSVGNIVCVLGEDRQMEVFLRKSIMPKVQGDRYVGNKTGIL